MIGIAKAAIVECGPGTGIECGGDQFVILIQNVFQFGLTLAAIAVTASLAFAALMYITSGGSTEKTGQARGAVMAAVTGLVISLSAWVIVNTVVTILVPQCKNWNIFEFSKTCSNP